jgi:putative Mn2+ efflux pump MntP
MSLLEIILIALSISLDVAVVSVGAGVLARLSLRRTLLIALCFGIFHAGMPLLGWYAGYWFRDYALEYGRVIGFALILMVGLRMLKAAFEKENTKRERNLLQPRTLFILAFATSIDALAIGVTFSFLDVPVALAVLVIGIVTFLMSLAGVYIGRRGRRLIGTRIEFVGAVFLILLAFKVLLF